MATTLHTLSEKLRVYEVHQELPELSSLSEEDIVAAEVEGKMYFDPLALCLAWPALDRTFSVRYPGARWISFQLGLVWPWLQPRYVASGAADFQPKFGLLIQSVEEDCCAFMRMTPPEGLPETGLAKWNFPISPAGYLMLFRKKGTYRTGLATF